MRNLTIYESLYKIKSFEETQIYYRRKKLLEVMNRYKHNSILEIGCGTEPLFAHMEDYKFMTVVEPVDSFYENALRLSEQDNRIVCLKGFFEDKLQSLLKYQPFDYIFANILTESEDIARFYDALQQICTKDTVVYLCVLNAASLHRILAYEAGLIENVSVISERGKRLLQCRGPYTMVELCGEVEKHGFKILEKGSYFPKLFTHQQMKSMLEQNIISKDVLEGMYKMGKYFTDYGSEIYVACAKR